MTGHRRLQLGEIKNFVVNKTLLAIQLDGFKVTLRSVLRHPLPHIFPSRLVIRKNGVLSSRLDRHVRNRHPVIHVHRRNPRPLPLHRPIGRPIKANIADDMQNHILSHHPRLHLPLQIKAHRLWHFDQKLARSKNEAGVGVADSRGKLIKSPRHTSMGIRSKKDFPRPRMPLPRKRGVANSRVIFPVLLLELPTRGVKLPVPVRVINHVVKIGKPLFTSKITEDIHVAVRKRVRRKDVMIRNDHEFLWIPNLRCRTKFPLKDPDRSRSTDIVRHQNVHIYPHIIARTNVCLTARAS